MLILHPNSTCDVCLDNYSNSAQSPHAIACGHVFCNRYRTMIISRIHSLTSVPIGASTIFQKKSVPYAGSHSERRTFASYTSTVPTAPATLNVPHSSLTPSLPTRVQTRSRYPTKPVVSIPVLFVSSRRALPLLTFD